MVYLFFETLPPLGLARSVREARSPFLLGRARFYLSQSPTSPVTTDDKDDAASASRAGKSEERKDRRKKDKKGTTIFFLFFLASTVLPVAGIVCESMPHHSFIPCSLHPSPLLSHPVPTAACASCSMARKITEPSIVFSLLPYPTGGIFAGEQYAGNSELGRCNSPDGKLRKKKVK